MTANTLEFFVKMKDLMSGGLVKLAQNSQNTFAKMKGNIAGMDNQTKFLNGSVDQLRMKLKQVNEIRFGTVMRSEFRQATTSAQALERQISRMEGRRSGRGFGRGILGAASYIGPIAIAGGAMSFGSRSVKAAMDFQAQSKSYEVLTGNRSVGKELAMQLRQLKQDTIMGVSVYSNAQRMLAFNISNDKVIPDLKMLGDVSMGDAQKLKRITIAFAETESAGKLTGRRLLQFVNAGFNPLLEISKKTGKSMGTLTKEMRKGAITAGMVEDALKSSTSEGGRFNHMMDQIGETSFGKMKKLEGQWANFKIEAGEALMPIASGLMLWSSELLNVFHNSNSVSDSLRNEKADVNGLVGLVTSLNDGNKTRKNLLQELITKYPDLFGKLDIEKTKNSELLDILNKINGAYDTRISKAANAELHDQYGKERDYAQVTADHYNAILNLVQKGNFADAIQLKDKWLPGMSDAELKDPSKRWMLTGGLKDQQNLANQARSKYNRVTSNDNWDFVTKEAIPFYKSNYKKLPKGFMAQYKKMFAGIGWDPKAHTGNMAMLANYDLSAIRSMVSAKDITTKIKPDDPSDDTKVASSIAGGGPRVININGVKFTDKIEIHSNGVSEGMDDMERQMQEMFLRILNSGASVQG